MLTIRTHQRMTMTIRKPPIHKPVILLIRLLNHQRNYSHIPTNLDNDTSSAFVVHPVTGESLRFPFITDEMKTDDYFDADFDSDLGDTDSNTSLDHDLGAGEAYLANCGDNTLTEDDLIDEELTISRFNSLMQCQDIDCTTSSHCNSDKLYCDGLNAWLSQVCTTEPPPSNMTTEDSTTTTSAALYDPNSINNQIQLHRTHEADTAEAYRAMAERLEREDEAIIDSGSNIHLFTLEDAQKFFSALRRTNMEVIGISNTSERCSAEGRITVLVRDSTGKLLNLDLGIGYSSRLVPKSIISVAQLMTKGSIFHFERGNCYLRTPTNQQISITERNGHFYIPLKELQSGDAKTDEDESAQGSNEQQPFLGFAGTVETDEDTCNIKEKQLQLIAQEERLEPTALNTQLSQQRATRRSQKHIFHGYRKQLIERLKQNIRKRIRHQHRRYRRSISRGIGESRTSSRFTTRWRKKTIQ